MKNLIIKTSFVSPLTIQKFKKEEWLPFFCLRSIYNSTLIGTYTDTAIHLKNLSPTSELYQKFRDKKIDFTTYSQDFIKELEVVDLCKIIDDIEFMCNLCDAKGAVLLTYGTDPSISHRSVLKDLINDLKILKSPVEEFKL